jgi:N-acetylglucosaminyl-diphospho-decaprenol L-rhamnosyltransferase
MSRDVTDLVVAIVNHSNREDTLACLRSLEGDSGRRVSVQVVVLDNASDDGSVEAIRAAHPGVEVIAQNVRRGFGANQNAIIQATSSRYVLALNNDTLVERGALDTLVGYLDEHPGVGAAGPRVVGPDGQAQLSAWAFPTVWNAAVHVLAGSRPAGPAPVEVGYVSGCALLLRRTVLSEVGGFDEDYFMYAEEKDLCRRIHDAGFTVELVPSATVVHLEARSSAGASARRETEFWRSQRLYLRKHHSAAGALAIEAQTALQRLALAAAVGAAGALPARVRPRRTTPGLARELARQARSSLLPPHGPGLRELADEQNARQRRAAA